MLSKKLRQVDPKAARDGQQERSEGFRVPVSTPPREAQAVGRSGVFDNRVSCFTPCTSRVDHQDNNHTEAGLLASA
jgi:hypothetical protein